MATSDTVLEAIDQFIAFNQFRNTLDFNNLSNADMAELQRRIDLLEPVMIPGLITNIVVHYEIELAKNEIQNGRFNLIKQAVREVMLEQGN
jgi:predicted lipoprotein